MTHDEMIEVIQAHKEGKAIERDDLLCVGTEWERMPRDGKFNFATFRYRVKPEPMECWAVHYGNPFSTIVKLYPTEKEALASASCSLAVNSQVIRLREVLDE